MDDKIKVSAEELTSGIPKDTHPLVENIIRANRDNVSYIYAPHIPMIITPYPLKEKLSDE